MKKEKTVNWKIAGEAGQGQQIAGLVLSQACLLADVFAFSYSEYPSQLRGGLVANQVALFKEPVNAVSKKIDFFFALSHKSFNYFKKDLNKRAFVFYDSDEIEINKGSEEFKFIPLPFKSLTKENETDFFMTNILIVGISAFLFNFDFKVIEKAIEKIFQGNGKSKELIERNIKAAQVGYKCLAKNIKPVLKKKIKLKESKKLILTGNEAIVKGAIYSKCGFYSAYPMTPASSILHILAKKARDNKMAVVHSEDEIAAINMAIGASWAGKRAMTGTSGGGIALMNEGINLAAMSETPLVVVDAQRPGPATGMATWTEQGDLQYLTKIGYGDFPRIILAPSNPEEAFYFTILAFNLADIYQMPVFILTDKYVSESYKVVNSSDLKKIEINRGNLLTEEQLSRIENYKRYALVKDGVSPRSVPGQKKGIFLANGNEHNEYGCSIDGFSGEIRKKQMEKRHAKLADIIKDLPKPELLGSKKASLTLIGWGSVKGPVLEALKHSSNFNYIHIPCFPFNEKTLLKLLDKGRNKVVIENNYKGQLADLMQEVLGMKFENRLNKYNGQQFFPEEIIEEIKKF